METAALAVAIAMHLNYLMGILWLPLVFAPSLRAWQAASHRLENDFASKGARCFRDRGGVGKRLVHPQYRLTGNRLCFFPTSSAQEH
jgi:hypothetical protein